MYNPLVSIIIPVYNGSNFLSQAIDSALNQTYQNIEILVINDGSNDDGATETVALSYGNKIRYFSKRNGGVSSALNLGIMKMKGEWFSWLSHDDIYNPDKIKIQIQKVDEDKKDRTIVLCSGSLMDMDCNNIFHPQKSLNKKLDGLGLFNEFLKGYALNGLGFLIPKVALERINGFDESMRYLQDLDCWLRLMHQDYTFICHRDLLVKTRVHFNQYTNTHSELFITDKEHLSRKHIKELTLIEEGKSIELLKLYLYLFERDNNVVGKDLAKNILIKKSEYSIFIAFRVFIIGCNRNISNVLKKVYKVIVLNKRRNI